VREHRSLHVLQFWAWRDAEFVCKYATQVPVDIECLRLPPAAVQGNHEQQGAALSQWFGANQSFQIRDRSRVLTQPQHRLCTILEGGLI
jgi:hypothetical protein